MQQHSMLHPAGSEAAKVATLWHELAVVAAVVFVLVVAVATTAIRAGMLCARNRRIARRPLRAPGRKWQRVPGPNRCGSVAVLHHGNAGGAIAGVWSVLRRHGATAPPSPWA
jgi:hypothetical protein